MCENLTSTNFLGFSDLCQYLQHGHKRHERNLNNNKHFCTALLSIFLERSRHYWDKAYLRFYIRIRMKCMVYTWWIGGTHRYRKEIPELLYHPVWWPRQPWRTNWGFSGFCRPHMRGKKKKKTQIKCVHNFSRTVWCFMHVYLHAQTAIHTHLTNQFFDHGKTQIPPIGVP